jgi:hypothetical protein
MPISVQWGNEEKTILHYTVTDDWSLDDAWHILENDVPKLYQDIHYVADVIIEFRQSPKIPLGVLDFWRRAYSWMQEHRGETSYVTVVQAPPIIKGIADTLRNLRAPITRLVLFVETIDEAHEKIAKYRTLTPRIHLED